MCGGVVEAPRGSASLDAVLGSGIPLGHGGRSYPIRRKRASSLDALLGIVAASEEGAEDA